MGIFASIGSWIWGAITSLTAVIASSVAYIATLVKTALASIAVKIGASLNALTTQIGSWIATTWQNISSGVKAITAKIVDISKAVYANIKFYVEYLGAEWKAFAKFIHLDTIIKLNNIGLIVSKDYRLMMQKFWGNISEISSALNIGAHTLTLLLRNARSVVLDTSAMLGQPYDVGEMQWFKTFQNFLPIMEQRAEHYANTPSDLLVDIDNNIFPDVINTKASTMQTVFTTIDKTIDSVSEIALDIDKVNDDVKKFVADLPENIREKVEHYTKPLTDKVDHFIDTEYLPVVNNIQSIVGILSNTQSDYKDKFDTLVDRIKKPAHYLKEIDRLALPERTEQENIIGEIAGRTKARILEPVVYEVTQMSHHIQQVVELQEGVEEPNKWEVGEIDNSEPLPAGETGNENSWFVGDY